MTTLEPITPRLARSGAEIAALAEWFCVRAFAAAALFCAAAAASAIAMLPLRDSATPVPWSTPTVILAGVVVLAGLAVARFPEGVYRALCRRPALELIPVVAAGAMLAYPLRSELWWPSCALVMLVAHVAPLSRTWLYCVLVLAANLVAHALNGDLSDTPAESIVGLWIGFGFWATLAGVMIDRIAAHLLRVDVGREAPSREPSPPEAEDPEPEPEDVTAPLALTAPAPPPPPAAERTVALTRRQLQVVALLADGLRYDEIAACLSISRTQVQRHVAAAVKRIGARNANELVTLAVGSGLVPPADER